MAGRTGKGGQYIRLRGGVWWLHRRVPKDLEQVARGTHIRKSLRTGDRREAEREAAHAWSEELRSLQDEAGGPKYPRWLQRHLAELARLRDSGEIDSEAAGDMMGTLIDQHLARQPRKALDERRHPLDPSHVAAIRSAVERFHDPSAVPLSEVVEAYLEEQERRDPPLPASTIYKMRRALAGFSAFLQKGEGDLPLAKITRRHAGGYVSELLRAGRAPATNTATITMIGTFWRWANLKGYTEADPWVGQVQSLKGTRRGNGRDKRRAFTQPELLKLVNAAGAEDRRWRLAVLAAYTGCRLEEIASTEVKDVDLAAGWLYLPAGKTDSSVRHVPIHPIIAPLVQHLVATSSDGFLMAGLKPRGMDKRRGSYIGDRTNELIRKAVTNDPLVTFHSLRKSFARALDNAGTPKNIAESLIGHRRQSMTYDTYSSGPDFEVLRDAMAKVSYGEVDDAVRAALSDHLTGDDGALRA